MFNTYHPPLKNIGYNNLDKLVYQSIGRFSSVRFFKTNFEQYTEKQFILITLQIQNNITH